MVALHDKNTDVSAPKAHHLLAEKQAGVEVLPVAVIDIASKKDEVDTLTDRPVDQSLQRTSRSSAQPFNGSAIVTVEAAEGAVDV